MHVMSLWGMMPPNFEVEDTKTGNMMQFVPNTIQKLLWDHWTTMLSMVNPDCIIINGDICDGPARRNMGSTVVSSNLEWQKQAALAILDTLPNNIPKYFTVGTDYHSVGESGMPMEYVIAHEMGDVYGDDLLIEECGIRIHASHNISISNSAWMYRTTPVARDLMLMELNSAADRYGPVDLLVRSHAHYYTSVSFPHSMGLITPAWQTRTPFAVTKNILSPPDNGWITIRIDDDQNISIDRRGLTHIGRPCKIVGRDYDSRANT